MDIEHATVDDIVHELAKRGLHGMVAIDDVALEASSEQRRGVSFFGSPIVTVGLADEALRIARQDLDELREGA